MPTDVNNTALFELFRTENHLRQRLQGLGPVAKKVRVTHRLREIMVESFANLATVDPASGNPSSLMFRGIPVVADLPSDHPRGFVIVYEA